MHQNISEHVGTAFTNRQFSNEGTFKYTFETRVTFCYTNAEGNMNHFDYPKLFGICRELFALDFIPNFAEEAGRKYLLKTRNAYYDYKKDFFFGDAMRIELWIQEASNATFTVEAEFINAATGELHARGRQEIVYTDMSGKPRRMPEDLKTLILRVMPMQ